jgi:hypothetical protein
VTVPVARASARRTVRVAAGLVAGQAVLCAVIGYVTLGNHGTGGTNAARILAPIAGDPMKVPLVAVPPSPSPTTEAPKPPPAATSTTARKPASSHSRHGPEPTPAPTTAAEEAPGILVGASPPTTEPATLPPSAPSSDSTSTTPSSETAAPSPPVSQSTPVTAGDICEPENAQAITTDGKAALCLSGTDGVLRWQTIE